MTRIRTLNPFAAALALVVAALAQSSVAQEENTAALMTYADLADLVDGSTLVLTAEVRKQAELRPEQAPALPPGVARVYIEARTASLLAGSVPVGESLRYLADLPRDSRGKLAKLKNQQVIIFARPVAGRPGEIQLASSDAQLLWSESLEARTRTILRESVSRDAPPRIRSVREVLSVAGTLAGESETQMFLDTDGDGPVSITVVRRPGQAPIWGVSWSEIVDQSAQPPQRETLEWYRLACFLPSSLPQGVSLSASLADRRRAEQDYRFVLEQLGDCPRNRS